MATIGTASITLTDISDAIIAGSMPASTNPGQLWIDTSGATNVLKVYKNGQWLTQELDVESMDSHLKQTIQTITDTLGTISDDNKLNHADRVMIVDSLADILGVVPSTKATNKYPTALPDYTVLDANGSGTFASYRSSAIALGIEDTSGEYIELKDAYLALINYLQLLASGNVMPWDITEAKKGTILDVDSDQFRQTWLDYYMAEQALVRRILEVPGPAGAPAISGILDNDSVTIPTKADGTGGIYTRASTKMLVYVGDTNDTAKWSFSAAKDPSAGIVGTLTGNLYVVSSMAADTGYVDLTASREGYASVSKRFSLTKAKQGDTVVDYWVETDYPVIVKDRDDVYTPTALTITAHTQTGTELPKSFSGIIKIEESNDGKVYTSKYTSTNPESSKVWTPSAGIKSMRIKLLTANGANQLDYEIVQVVADGKDGADGYSPIYSELTNESMTVTTDVNGANGGYGGAESTIHIYQGQVEVTDQYNISVAISEGSGITGTRTGSTYKVTNMTADSGYVDFIATRSGHLTLTRRFTISKSKTGAAGKPATSRWLTLDTPVIRKMVTGAYFPASITMKAWQATGDQAPTAYTGRFRISINTGGSTYTVKTTTGDVTSHTYSVPENVTGIKIELLSTGGATWLDEETIQVIQDGKDGAPGKDGLSAVVGFLTNENISVQATYNGAVSNYGHVKGTFEVYYGNTRVTGSNVSYSVDTANTSNLTVAIDSVTGAYSVTGITSGTSVTSGVATLKAVYEGVTITKVLTVTKSMAGTNGGNATAYWMITSAGVVSRTLDAVFTPSTITFTGKSKTGTAAPTNYSGRFVIEQTTNGYTWTSLSNTGTNVTSVTVTPAGAAIAVRAKFYLAGGTSVLLDEQTVPIVTDITDEVLNDIKDDIDDKTGTGLWKLDTYMGTTDLIPELKHTRDNTKLIKSDTVKDFTNSTVHTADTNKVYHLYTHLETAAATNIALKVDHTAGITILVNGGEPIYSSSVSGLAKTVTLPLAQGWNTVDILLRSTTTGAYVKFDKLISASVVKMSSYLGGGVSTSRLLMMQDEISFAVVQGERVAGISITNDVINGANVEISGDTTFKDDIVMDAGSLRSKDGGVDIDLNAGTINLTKPLTINFNPVATQQQLEEIALTPGKSAYELAVDAGFVGTESQWRASLKGDKGIQGPQGATGSQGPQGASPIVGLLTNESITLPASSAGVVSSFTGATGTFEVYNGTTRKTGSGVAYSVSGTPSSGINVSINATTGVYTVSAMATGASVLSGIATLRAVYSGVTIDKILTVTKALAGTQGAPGTQGATGATGGTGATGSAGQNATTYWINASTNAIKKDVTGTIVPNTITFSGFSKTGTANPVAYAGRFIIQTSTDGVSYTTAYTSSANQSSYTYTVPTTASFVKSRYYLAGGTSILLDEQTVPVLVDAEGIDKKYEGQSLLDKTEILSGTEIYTDKAEDNSVVHVDIDGKSVGGGSGKNLISRNIITNTSGVYDFSKYATSGLIIMNKSGPYDGIRIDSSKVTTGKYIMTFKFRKLSGKLLNIGGHRDTGWGSIYMNIKDRVTNHLYDSPPGIPDTYATYEVTLMIDIKADISDTQLLYIQPNRGVETPVSIELWDWQLEEGSIATAYEPPAPTPDYPIAINSLNNFDVVSSVGKENLLPNSDFSKSMRIQDNTFTIGEKSYNKYPQIWGGYNGGLKNHTTNYHAYLDSETFKFNTLVFNESNGTRHWKGVSASIADVMSEKDSSYMFSATINTTNIGSKLWGGFYYVKKGASVRDFHSGHYTVVPTKTNEWHTVKGEVPFPADVDLDKGVSFYIYGHGFSQNAVVYVKDVKLEVGTASTPSSKRLSEVAYDTPTPTTYKINILLSEPLRSVGDVKDRLFRDSDGLWKVERNIKERILNGSKPWFSVWSEQASINTVSFYWNPADSFVDGTSLPESEIGIASNLFNGYSRNNLFKSDTEGIAIGGSGSPYLVIRILKSRLNSLSVTDFKSWLAKNPILAQYRIAPKIETLPQADQDKLNNIASHKDSNYVYTIVDGTNTLPEYVRDNLNPTLHATFKGGGWYSRFKTEEGFNRTNKSVDSLKNETIPALKDGLLNSSEKEAVRQSLNVVSADKKGIDMQYTTVYANTALTGTAKSNLKSAKDALNTAFTNLQSAINAVLGVGDGTRITDAQMTLVTTRLNGYGTALSTYNQRYEQAQDAISTKKKELSDAYALAQAELAETESKAYADGKITDEEKRAIADAQAKLTEAKKYVDALEIGGRNLLLNSKTLLTSRTNEVVNFLGREGVVKVTNNGNSMYIDPIESLSDEVNDKDDYVLSVDFTYIGTKGPTPRFYMGTYQPVEGIIEEGKFNRIYIKSKRIDRIHMHCTGFQEIYLHGWKLEKGSKATDWTEAPEDVEARIDSKADSESTNAEIEGIKSTLEGTVSVDDYEKQMNEYSKFIETVQTDANNAKSKSEELDILLNDPEKGIVTNLGDAYKKINSLEGYLSFDGKTNTLTLARTANSSTKIMISDTSIDFMDGNDQVASITNQYLKIQRGIFASSVQISKHIIKPDDGDSDHLVFTYLG